MNEAAPTTFEPSLDDQQSFEGDGYEIPIEIPRVEPALNHDSLRETLDAIEAQRQIEEYEKNAQQRAVEKESIRNNSTNLQQAIESATGEKMNVKSVSFGVRVEKADGKAVHNEGGKERVVEGEDKLFQNLMDNKSVTYKDYLAGSYIISVTVNAQGERVIKYALMQFEKASQEKKPPIGELDGNNETMVPNIDEQVSQEVTVTAEEKVKEKPMSLLDLFFKMTEQEEVLPQVANESIFQSVQDTTSSPLTTEHPVQYQVEQPQASTITRPESPLLPTESVQLDVQEKPQFIASPAIMYEYIEGVQEINTPEVVHGEAQPPIPSSSPEISQPVNSVEIDVVNETLNNSPIEPIKNQPLESPVTEMSAPENYTESVTPESPVLPEPSPTNIEPGPHMPVEIIATSPTSEVSESTPNPEPPPTNLSETHEVQSPIEQAHQSLESSPVTPEHTPTLPSNESTQLPTVESVYTAPVPETEQTRPVESPYITATSETIVEAVHDHFVPVATVRVEGNLRPEAQKIIQMVEPALQAEITKAIETVQTQLEKTTVVVTPRPGERPLDSALVITGENGKVEIQLFSEEYVTLPTVENSIAEIATSVIIEESESASLREEIIIGALPSPAEEILDTRRRNIASRNPNGLSIEDALEEEISQARENNFSQASTPLQSPGAALNSATRRTATVQTAA